MKNPLVARTHSECESLEESSELQQKSFFSLFFPISFYISFIRSKPNGNQKKKFFVGKSTMTILHFYAQFIHKKVFEIYFILPSLNNFGRGIQFADIKVPAIIQIFNNL